MTWACSWAGIPANTAYGGGSWSYLAAACMRDATVSRFGLVSTTYDYDGVQFVVFGSGTNLEHHYYDYYGADDATMYAKRMQYNEANWGWKSQRSQCFPSYNANSQTGTGNPSGQHYTLCAARPYGAANNKFFTSSNGVGRIGYTLPANAQLHDVGGPSDYSTSLEISTIAANYAQMTLDVSFMFRNAGMPDGMRGNEEFGKVLTTAACKLNLSAFKYQWIVPATTPMEVNIYSGTLPTSLTAPAPDAGDTLLATFTGLYTADFGVPDAYGKFALMSTKSVAAAATGTAGYAEIVGAYSSTATKPKLYVPVSTIDTTNYITLSTLDLVSAATVQLTGMGFDFAVGT